MGLRYCSESNGIGVNDIVFVLLCWRDERLLKWEDVMLYTNALGGQGGRAVNRSITFRYSAEAGTGAAVIQATSQGEVNKRSRMIAYDKFRMGTSTSQRKSTS